MGIAESLGGTLGSVLPPWAVVTLISLLPFIEMRGAVPIAVLLYGWDLGFALAYCGAVSIIPGFVIAFYMERLEPRLRKVGFFDRTLDRVFAWTRKKNAEPAQKKKRDRRATLLLALLVAIPGPGTGAWTGGLVSYVFEVPKRRAAAALALGVIGEAVVIAALVLLFQWSVGALP